MWKWLLAAVLFFLVVVELVFFAPNLGDREVDPSLAGTESEQAMTSDVEQVLKGTHLIEAQGEKKVWELFAETARKQKASPNWSLDKVNVKFFGENAVTYTCVGNEGFVGDNQQKLKVSGNVVITSNNGYIMKTPVVFYRTDTRTIDGPEPVELQGPPEKDEKSGGPLYMEADFFDANLNTNIINLKQNVRGRKQMSGNRRMKIRSHEAQFSGQSKYALFKKDVVMDVDTMTVTGPRAKFIYRDGELHSLLITGGVKIKDIGKWGVAGEAEVFFQEDKYIFRDNPKVVQGKDQLIGDEIIVYDGGDRIQVKKAKTKYQTKQEGEEGF